MLFMLEHHRSQSHLSMSFPCALYARFCFFLCQRFFFFCVILGWCASVCVCALLYVLVSPFRLCALILASARTFYVWLCEFPEEPGLAVSLLNMVKSWVADMKKDGEEMKTRYVQLQESVQNLIVRAQNTKFDADRRLAEAVQAVETEAQKSPREQPSQQYLTAGESCSPPRVDREKEMLVPLTSVDSLSDLLWLSCCSRFVAAFLTPIASV